MKCETCEYGINLKKKTARSGMVKNIWVCREILETTDMSIEEVIECDGYRKRGVSSPKNSKEST